ncbi:MAG: GDP-L-fucose synthase [Deltaproteobacteria bacterium]|nr:GDP-L-fucose synthase [Deltaproteobacteria bacterium]
MARIVVTGASGFLGTHVLEAFREEAGHEILSLSRREYDLTREEAVGSMFADLRPDYVVHLAGLSGGIQSNRIRPADYFHENILLLTHMFHHAARNGVRRLLVPMGGCSYPATAPSPIREEEMWNGYPQGESAGYSVAKKMSLVLSEVYRKQDGLESVVVIPGNLYGEHDNYSLADSHVIPAMIRKIHAAKTRGERKLAFWGTGAPRRDFVYVGDVAALIPYFLFDYRGDGPVNLSSGTSISIRDLAGKIASIFGYGGEIEWDASYPDGQMVKIFSVERLRNLGKSCPTPIDEGLRKTVAWYEENYPGGIRL